MELAKAFKDSKWGPQCSAPPDIKALKDTQTLVTRVFYASYRTEAEDSEYERKRKKDESEQEVEQKTVSRNSNVKLWSKGFC